jgi:hypothetical protein
MEKIRWADKHLPNVDTIQLSAMKLPVVKLPKNDVDVGEGPLFFTYNLATQLSSLEINLDVIPVIMTGGSLNLPVTAEFMPVIVTP